VLIIGSGNIVHNLRTAVWRAGAYDWAIEFDEQVKFFADRVTLASLSLRSLWMQ
jgi:4,5-DOPA dioxygenase extradiol